MVGIMFENDVKIYGIQTVNFLYMSQLLFENDVKIYGIQTVFRAVNIDTGLRMM